MRVWLDGGWAVDANLGTQTRRHADLDVVIERRHLAEVLAALLRRGYAPVARDDTSDWNSCTATRRDPWWLVQFHTGYEVDHTDWHDVSALCSRFGVPVPPAYRRFPPGAD